MAIDREELSKLKPEERIKKLKEIEKELKELEESRKKELSEAEKLIKETRSQIDKEHIESKIAIPETKHIDIASLFESGEGIEAIAEKAPKAFENAIKYQIEEDYEALVSMYGNADQKIMEKVDVIGERLEKARYHVQSEELSNMIVASKALAYKIRKFGGKEHAGSNYGA